MTRPEPGVGDCWNSIGVWGELEPRCELLADVVHCQNCSFYTAAGRRLLEEAPPSDYIAEWTRALAEAASGDVRDVVSLLIFRLGESHLAIRTAACHEVALPGPVRRVPHRTDRSLLGIVNVRGELRLCIDPRELLGLEPATRTGVARQARMVVIERDGLRWVLPVDEVLGIEVLPARQLEHAPATVARDRNAFCKLLFEWRGQRVSHLDETALFDELQRRFPL